MKRVGIITLYRGYNYGTSLQAYGLKTVIREMGYDAQLLWTRENTHSGRDIRLDKLVRMAFRLALHPELRKRTIRGYQKSFGMHLEPAIKRAFLDFEEEELKVQGLSRHDLRIYARDPDTQAVVCGSDQIWSAATANVEPLYYLSFVPDGKKVAYAPSFGASAVPDYNRRSIGKYLGDFSCISVREAQGAKIVKLLTGRTVPVVLDPTLLLRWEQWESRQSEPYFLLYFLNEPSEAVVKRIARLRAEEHCRVYALPYQFEQYRQIPGMVYPSAGPKEFVCLVRNARCVFTDSFHGTAFSVNFQVPFWAFARNDGREAAEQSGRITDFLELLGLRQQYVQGEEGNPIQVPEIDFQTAGAILKEHIQFSRAFLREALERAQ